MSFLISQANRCDLDKQIIQISEKEQSLSEIEIKILCEKVVSIKDLRQKRFSYAKTMFKK